jgi:hypothetical protein
MVVLLVCCVDQSCPKPDRPYFDYKAITVETTPPHPISPYPEVSFGFTIHLKEIEYLASNEINQDNGLGLINSAYARDCYYDVDWGAKYGFQAINIYADSTFDASIPNGEPLNSLFEVLTDYNDGTKIYQKISLENISNFPNILKKYMEIKIVSNSIPVAINRPYYFEIEVVKENGDIIRSTVGPLVWKN